MVLRRVFRYLAEKWSGFRKWLRCAPVECINGYGYRCRLEYVDAVNECLRAVSIIAGNGGLSYGEAEELRKACFLAAGQRYNKCIELYKECCSE